MTQDSMYTEYTTFKEAHKDAGNNIISDIFSYNHYRHSWYSLLDLEIGFMCPKCERLPQVVIMDATSLAFQRDLLITTANKNWKHNTKTPKPHW